MVTTLRPYVERSPDDIAVVDDRGRLTWRELDEAANRWVHVLRSMGLTAADRVVLVSRNRAAAVEVILGCLHAGVTVVPATWQADADGLAYIFGHSRARLVLTDQTCAATVAAALALQPVEQVLAIGPGPATGSSTDLPSASGVLAGASADEPDDQVAGGVQFYTSGTTGRPKGVVSTLPASVGSPVEAMLEGAGMVAGALGYPPGGAALLSGPLFHSGQFVMALSGLLLGQKLVLLDAPDADTVLRTIDAEAITNVVLLPIEMSELLALPSDVRDGFDGSSLVNVIHGGAPCPPSVKQALLDWWGPRITEYYGATEVGLMALADATTHRERPGSVGRVVPHLDVLIADEAGAPVAAGTAGTLHLAHRGGGDLVYADDPERTAAAHELDGRFTLGDIGYFDEDGFLFIVGRRSDLVVTSAGAVLPYKVEAVLAGHASVADVGVFALGDAPAQRVAAAVVPSVGVEGADRAGLAEVLAAHAADRLDAHEVPVVIDVLDVMPRSAAGKILKHELRARHEPA